VSRRDVTAAELERRLRAGDPPVVARIERDGVVLDLRTVAADEDGPLGAALEASLRGSDPGGGT
jgi:L-seryl-tRNA(Ser) seleniumtransferase